MKELHFKCQSFEQEAREALQRPEGPIFDTDVLRVTRLDLRNFNFKSEDIETLTHFENLTELSMDFYTQDMSFLSAFRGLETLDICCGGEFLDFRYFTALPNLKNLYLSFGVMSNIALINLEALTELRKLEILCLHDFGMVDLSPLMDMPHLKSLSCGYANEVRGIDAIGSLINLEELDLTSLKIKNLDFLESLPDSMSLELCAVELLEQVDLQKLERFRKRDISEIYIEGERVIGW